MKELEIIDIKRTSRKKIIEAIKKRIKISIRQNSLLDSGISVKLLAYINPKTNPISFGIIRKASNYNNISDSGIKKIGAYLCLEGIEEMMEGSKVRLPAKFVIDEYEDSPDGKTSIPISHAIYCNVKIRDKNLIGLEK